MTAPYPRTMRALIRLARTLNYGPPDWFVERLVNTLLDVLAAEQEEARTRPFEPPVQKRLNPQTRVIRTAEEGEAAAIHDMAQFDAENSLIEAVIRDPTVA